MAIQDEAATRLGLALNHQPHPGNFLRRSFFLGISNANTQLHLKVHCAKGPSHPLTMAASTSTSVIPRFLLPLQSPLWRGIRLPLSQSVRVRYSSSSTQADGKPIVLEKPARFNPPSHGSRLKRNAIPKHWSPPLTDAEIKVRSQRSYPGMMAPQGSWQHWFWHSKLLHTFITMVRYS